MLFILSFGMFSTIALDKDLCVMGYKVFYVVIEYFFTTFFIFSL